MPPGGKGIPMHVIKLSSWGVIFPWKSAIGFAGRFRRAGTGGAIAGVLPAIAVAGVETSAPHPAHVLLAQVGNGGFVQRKFPGNCFVLHAISS